MSLKAEDCSANLPLLDGSTLHVRAIRPDDKQVLVEEFRRLSPESVRARFFTPKKELSPAELVYLTEVDFVDHLALIAELRGRPVGVGRIVRGDDPEHAELAVTVAEDFHGLGIGSALLKRLAGLAPAMGVRYFDAHVLDENEDMLDVFRNSGFPMHTRSDEGTRIVTLDVGSR